MKRGLLVLATYNEDKVKEIRSILGGKWELVSLNQFSPRLQIAETGSSFEENALIKAKAAHSLSGLPALADDSGLCVDALNGLPGICSARFAGEHASAKENNDRLLCMLQGVPFGKRTAKFVCCVALVGEVEHIETGEVEGKILESPRGNRGFGYDPLFLYPGKRKAFAQMKESEKNRVSHRGIAFRKMASYLIENGFGA